MLLKQWNLLLLIVMISTFAGCGGTNTANVQNPPAQAAQKMSIAFQPVPTASISINATTALTAVVHDDPSNAGVDWTVICPTGVQCGSLSAPHSASGKPITYTPPATLAGNNLALDIVAYANADHSQNVVAPLTVSAFGRNLKGNYVMQAQGIDTSLGPYQFAGVIVLDGNGSISSGEQAVNFFDQNAGISLSKSDPIVGGGYFLGSDGRGTITINTPDKDVGLQGVETFSFVFLSPAQSLITQTDSTASASGTMELQTSTAAPNAGYAFVVSGTDIATQSPTAFGGVFNIDSPGTISGKGSISDQNLNGTMSLQQHLSGTVSAPDAFGAVTLNLTTGFYSTLQFTAYSVDATHLKLIETDNSFGSGSASTGGVAVAQGSSTGSFTTPAAFSGTYVFGLLGTDLAGFAPATLTWAGVLTADGAGNLVNGYMDAFFQQNSIQGTAGAQISSAFSGTYSVDIKGTGRARVNFNHLVPVPRPAFGPALFFYLTGNGNPPLVLDGIDTSANHNYPSLAAGIAYPQSSSLAFAGDYGFRYTQQNGSENDATGQMTVHSALNNLSGSVDSNSGLSPTFGNLLTGTFQPRAANGRFAGTLASQILDFSPLAAEFYAIDATRGFFLETDLLNPNGPTGVVSLGYYAARTSVCNSCP